MSQTSSGRLSCNLSNISRIKITIFARIKLSSSQRYCLSNNSLYIILHIDSSIHFNSDIELLKILLFKDARKLDGFLLNLGICIASLDLDREQAPRDTNIEGPQWATHPY